MTPPEIAYVPHFAALERIGCSRMAVAVYGAIAAYHARGYHPSVMDIAWTAKHATRRPTEEALAELVKRNLVRRERAATGAHRRNRYTLLGPVLVTANDNATQGETDEQRQHSTSR